MGLVSEIALVSVFRRRSSCRNPARIANAAAFVQALVAFGLVFVPSAFARDRLSIVGSSTVFPFATVVAERFSLSKGVAPPVIEATGTGGGFKLFCKGTGANTPDITNASARMKVSQLALCRKNGVDKVIEVAIGYDGIVVAQSLKGKPFALTLPNLYLALARQVPKEDGTLIDNPYKTWRDIDPALSALPIEVLGPPPTSGTRIAFVESVMDKGARSFPSLAALRKRNQRAFKQAAYALREDGAYIDSGENDNLIIQKLRRNPQALGIFGFSFLEQNRGILRGLSIRKGENTVAPTFDKIADGSYPIARALYFYVKAAHLERSSTLQAYVDMFLADDTMGEDGFLLDEGLIPLPPQELARVRQAVASRRAVEAQNLR